MKRAFWLMLAALPLAAQPKQLVNAQTATRSAAQGLEREFRSLLTAQPQPAWIMYRVPAVRNAGMGCDFVRDGSGYSGVVHLEPPDHAIILYRVEGNAVNRIRTLSPYCEIDAGNLPVHWINDVTPAQSIALLATFIGGTRENFSDTNVVSAIAVHSDPSADQALEKFLATNQPESLRLRAVSSLGAARGRHGFDVLKRLIASDPDERIRERAVQALGSSRENDAQDLLISIAKTDANSRLRSAAISSLNRKGGQRVLDTLVSIADADADSQVRQRAVSTLQSMPDGQGIPSLIQIARNGKTPDIKKRAVQALNHSRDPRALAFLEELLKR